MIRTAFELVNRAHSAASVSDRAISIEPAAGTYARERDRSRYIPA